MSAPLGPTVEYRVSEASARYIERLTGNEKSSVCFRTIDDDKMRKADAQNIDGALADCMAELKARNDEGFGVFVVVNEGGHNAAAIKRVRAVFIDGDDIPLPDRWHTPPHFLTVRDESHWHAYWLVENFPLHAFKPTQNRLAAHYGSDKAVTDLPRVMRVPGFWHGKNPADPIGVTLVDYAEPLRTYSLAAVTNGLPDLPADEVPRAPKQSGTGAPVTAHMLDEMLSRIDPDTKRKDGWLQVAAGIRDANVVTDDTKEPDENFDGLAVFLEWSSRSDKFEEADAIRVYKDMSPKAGGASFGSLVMLARAGGYDGPAAVTRQPAPPSKSLMSSLRPTAPQEADEWRDYDEFMQRDYPPTRFIVGDAYFMEGQHNGFHGAGGLGKGTIIIHAAQAIRCGAPLYGMQTLKRPVGIVLCEDPDTEIKKRLSRIIENFPLDFTPEVMESACPMLIAGREGKDSTIAKIDDNGDWKPGPFYEAFCKFIEACGPGAVIFADPITDMAELNPNFNTPVRALLKTVIGGLCHKYGVTIVYTVHPSKAAQKDGHHFGGSVQWRNSSRANSSLEPVYRKGKEGREDGDTGERIWRTAKGNYNGPASVKLVWSNRVLMSGTHRRTEKSDAVSEDFSDVTDEMKAKVVELCRMAAEANAPVQARTEPLGWIINDYGDSLGINATLRNFRHAVQAAKLDGLVVHVTAQGNYAGGFYPGPKENADKLSRAVKANQKARDQDHADTP